MWTRILDSFFGEYFLFYSAETIFSIWMLVQFKYFLLYNVHLFQEVGETKYKNLFCILSAVNWMEHSFAHSHIPHGNHSNMYLCLCHWQNIDIYNPFRFRMLNETEYAPILLVQYIFVRRKASPLNVAWLAIYVHVVFTRWVTYGLRVCLKRYNHRWKWSWILNEFPK